MHISESVRTSLEEVRGASAPLVLHAHRRHPRHAGDRGRDVGARRRRSGGVAGRRRPRHGRRSRADAAQADRSDGARESVSLARTARSRTEVVRRRGATSPRSSPVGETRAVITAGTVTRRVERLRHRRRSSRRSRIARRRRDAGSRERDDDGVAPVCILGYKLKQQLFGGDNAVGQQLNLGGRRLTVIGVGTEVQHGVRQRRRHAQGDRRRLHPVDALSRHVRPRQRDLVRDGESDRCRRRVSTPRMRRRAFTSARTTASATCTSTTSARKS